MNTRETELFHYGIKGMHWGVRRYQNKDGSYTAAGKARYDKAKSNYESAKSDVKAARKSLKKGESTQSDRYKAEENYTTAKENYKSAKQSLKQDIKADRGNELAEKNVGKGKTVLKGVAKGTAANAVSAIVNKNASQKVSSVTNVAVSGFELQNFLDTVYDWQAINLSRSRKASKAS